MYVNRPCSSKHTICTSIPGRVQVNTQSVREYRVRVNTQYVRQYRVQVNTQSVRQYRVQVNTQSVRQYRVQVGQAHKNREWRSLTSKTQRKRKSQAVLNWQWEKKK